MRVIIAGPRDRSVSVAEMTQVVYESGFAITVLICGMARGIDTSAHIWGVTMRIPIEEFHADWEKFGKSAGYRRNTEMAKVAEGLIALRKPGGSRGTQHMIDIALVKGLKVFVKEWK
jgi:hypothetical protein